MTGTGVWGDLIGQDRVVETLQRAVGRASHAMTHAWLFTGPPGSGRSNAARAFAAALQCDNGGCGHCQQCRMALAGTHPDVTLVRTERLSIGVEDVRELVRKAAMAPAVGRHQVIVVEDADRVTERGADALLKSLEEPAPRTVWILCAPTAQDMPVTVASRCRRVDLKSPAPDAIAEFLQRRDGITPDLAQLAARVSQGHIGRASAFARDPAVRRHRDEVLKLPDALVSVGACLDAAAAVVDMAAAEAAELTASLDDEERTRLEETVGYGGGQKPRQVASLFKELEDGQKMRATRLQRDALDRVLTELTSWYRDVLSVQLDTGTTVINADLLDRIQRAAANGTAGHTLDCIDAILACRKALMENVKPLLAFEALLLQLSAVSQPRLGTRSGA